MHEQTFDLSLLEFIELTYFSNAQLQFKIYKLCYYVLVDGSKRINHQLESMDVVTRLRHKAMGDVDRIRTTSEHKFNRE